MNTIDTCANLTCLINAYIGDNSKTGNSSDGYFIKLRDAGLVTLNHFDHWETTKKGAFYLRALLGTPFPEETFRIPYPS